jgi:peptidoglycan/LPS O-acetylase OafA/YrhL
VPSVFNTVWPSFHKRRSYYRGRSDACAHKYNTSGIFCRDEINPPMTGRACTDQTEAVHPCPPLPYEPAFDGLRAMAVGMVAFYHVDKTILPGGWAGVDIFFVLSGYLISRILLRALTLHGKILFREFYLRRALRLVPAFWCLLAVVAFTAPLRSDPTSTLEAVVAAGTYTINWTRAFHFMPQDILGHTWSLAIEEQFYLIWPVLLIFIYARKPARWLSVAIVVVIVWRCILIARGDDTIRIYTGFDTHCDGLLFGCLLAFAPPSKALARQAARTCYLPLMALALILIFCTVQSSFAQTIGFTVVAGISMWLIVAAQQPGLLHRWLVFPPFVYTGRISYGFYLWHYPLIALVNDRYGIRGSLVAIIISYAIAVVSYETIERKFLSFKARSGTAVTLATSDPAISA